MLRYGFGYATSKNDSTLASDLVVSHDISIKLELTENINRDEVQSLVDKVALLVQLMMGQASEVTGLELLSPLHTFKYGV